MVRCFGLTMRMSGGKGGFGSMLRAQGGRMSSQKSTNTDACRDLSGRRIKTVNEAKRIAEYVQQEPERERARKESLKRKIEEKLELAERPTRKHRFDDSKFFDEAEEQVEEVKSAVAAAIKANMKSRSTSPPSPSGSTSSSSSSSSSSSPSSSSSSSSAAAAAAANIGDLKGKGKGKEKAKEVAPRKPVIKKLGMW
ncbi:telomere stability and silencing-domain-containing protein [Lobosporangium transversale]|uniref:Telomere stability and silencing-domain-containing protein n=1 Tax=Lobosporangium transversale TaxID=64571 RepID=A0A1Y2GRY0_9FUNG|nr:telomere stability and silencing-domain-containing protein [Lobosporangium transversale]ORZ20897.1 telomere stability and silencing-domain-containing protein [Lobosporangium transversale]|eukprot:XP_021882806.1 telomere stability and silencing-domain-containing protein [Lobosporangium transversale]